MSQQQQQQLSSIGCWYFYSYLPGKFRQNINRFVRFVLFPLVLFWFSLSAILSRCPCDLCATLARRSLLNYVNFFWASASRLPRSTYPRPLYSSTHSLFGLLFVMCTTSSCLKSFVLRLVRLLSQCRFTVFCYVLCLQQVVSRN